MVDPSPSDQMHKKFLEIIDKNQKYFTDNINEARGVSVQKIKI